MFVLNPDPYSQPAYRIGPFRTSDLAINHSLPDSDIIDDYFSSRFPAKDYIYTDNGRKAINIALRFYGLKENDVVSIFTTTNNFYISSCVTNEIEKFCKWSRQIVPDTKVILVNHEFGYPYKDLHRLKDYNLPIIEDCACSFFSRDNDNQMGNTGDFAIYSFPKMFPMQIGGLLVSNIETVIDLFDQIDEIKLRHIKNALSYYIGSKDDIIEKRFYNYNYLNNKFESLGFTERFSQNGDSIPAVYMFKTDKQKIDLPELKKHFWAHGVQCSVFYGEEAFFIPVHQALEEHDMDYFYEVMKAFITNQGI